MGRKRQEHRVRVRRTGLCVDVALQYDGFVFSLQACGQPFLSGITLGIL